MTNTYIALATTTLSSATSTVTFSSIPATYRDLIVVVNARSSTGTTSEFRINPNGSTADGTRVVMFGVGSSVSSNLAVGTLPTSSDQFNQFIIQIMDYAQTDKHKTMLTRQSWANATVDAQAMRWAQTTAITSIQLQGVTQTMAVGSTFSLYGVN